MVTKWLIIRSPGNDLYFLYSMFGIHEIKANFQEAKNRTTACKSCLLLPVSYSFIHSFIYSFRLFL